jgi:hypothetical protein
VVKPGPLPAAIAGLSMMKINARPSNYAFRAEEQASVEGAMSTTK